MGKVVSHMAIVISTINIKGGVGKTTTTLGLAEMLVTEFKKKILFIDLDPQANATVMLIGKSRWQELSRQGYTLATLFEDTLNAENKKFELEKALQKNISNIINLENLELLPSSLELIRIQEILSKIPTGPFHENNPIEILKKAIHPIKYNYDYILIDCPSNFGIITLNGLRVANGYVIPTIPDFLSTNGLSFITDRIEEFAENMDMHIENLGIIVTKFEEDSSIHTSTLEKMKKDKKIRLLRSLFKESNQTAVAADYANKYNTFKDKWGENSIAFYHLAKEIIKQYEV